MSKQTALKWFVEQLGLDATNDYKAEIEEALQMEREQIIDSYKDGYYHLEFETFNPQQYYNETYGGQDEKN